VCSTHDCRSHGRGLGVVPGLELMGVPPRLGLSVDVDVSVGAIVNVNVDVSVGMIVNVNVDVDVSVGMNADMSVGVNVQVTPRVSDQQ
jgi:hypothetical protein